MRNVLSGVSEYSDFPGTVALGNYLDGVGLDVFHRRRAALFH